MSHALFQVFLKLANSVAKHPKISTVTIMGIPLVLWLNHLIDAFSESSIIFFS